MKYKSGIRLEDKQIIHPTMIRIGKPLTHLETLLLYLYTCSERYVSCTVVDESLIKECDYYFCTRRCCTRQLPCKYRSVNTIVFR